MKWRLPALAAALPLSALAEVSLERGPYSHRGVIAMMVVSWCAAATVMALSFRRGMEGRSRRPASEPRRARQLLSGLVEFAFGILLVMGVAGIWQLATAARPALPPGWKIIRPPQETSALAIDGELVWAGGMAGLTAIHRQSGALRRMDQPVLRYVRDLLLDRKGRLWVAHGDGLTVRDGGAWRDEPRFTSQAVLALMEDRNGAVWIGAEDGAYCYDGRDYRRVHDGTVSTMFSDRGGVVWLGSNVPEKGGLTSLDSAGSRQWSTRDGLAHNSVNAITQERSGALWFATGFSNRGGATRLNQGQWQSWRREDGLAGQKVRSIFEDRSGLLWFGSEYDGIAVTDRKMWRVLKISDGLAGREVKEMVQDPEGVYWLGTENGVSRIERFALGSGR